MDIKQIFNQVTGYWKNLDGATRRKVIVSIVLMLAVASTITWLITKPNYTVLYSGLDGKEAGEILQKLEEMKVDAKPEGTGTIRVPKKVEAKVRMDLAAEGYPKSGVNNYDSLKSSMGLGATDYDKQKADQYQLQERLESAIKTMDGVSGVIVTLTIPEQDSFVLKQDKLPSTASVLLTLSNATLTKKQVNGIVELVSKSVPGLKPENVSVVDNNMNSLNSSESSGAGAVSAQLELEQQVRDSLQRQVLNLLEPVFGKKKVVPSASFKLNFDKKVTNSIKFEPVTDDAGIAVSINELKEAVGNANGSSGGQVQYPVDSGNSQDAYVKSNNTINYEVNQINEQLEEAQGKITDLKLSVLIDNESLSDETKSDIQKVVANAIGVDTENVVVQGMVFSGAQADNAAVESKMKEAEKKELWYSVFNIVKYAALLLMLMFVLFMLYRFVSKIKLPVIKTPTLDYRNIDIGKSANFMDEIMELPQEDQEQIAKKQSIDNLVENKPDVVVQQIRDWLNEN